jgi:hypothetical protein
MKLLVDRLILIVGMVGIIWLMPLRFEKIAHPPRENIVGFCGHVLVSTDKDHIVVRNVETSDTRRISYPDATWLYAGWEYASSEPWAWSCQLMPAQGWLCAKATPQSGPRLDVIDLSSGRVVKRCQLPCWEANTAHGYPPKWVVTRDGRTLIYESGEWKLRCVEMASEKTLWESRHEGPWLISPDGRLVAVTQRGSIDVLERSSGRRICRLPNERAGESVFPVDISNDGSLLVDSYGSVFDTQNGKQLYVVPLSERNHRPWRVAGLMGRGALFTGGWLAYRPYADPTLVLADGVTGNIACKKPLLDIPSVGIQHGVSDNRLIWLDDTFAWNPVPRNLWNPARHNRWLDTVARWIPWLSNRLDAEPDNHWLLVDPTTGRRVFQTTDTLHAVSDDCRYLVTDGDISHWRLYQLPVRRPLLASILACLVWSVALENVRLLQRRWRPWATAGNGQGTP